MNIRLLDDKTRFYIVIDNPTNEDKEKAIELVKKLLALDCESSCAGVRTSTGQSCKTIFDENKKTKSLEVTATETVSDIVNDTEQVETNSSTEKKVPEDIKMETLEGVKELPVETVEPSGTATEITVEEKKETEKKPLPAVNSVQRFLEAYNTLSTYTEEEQQIIIRRFQGYLGNKFRATKKTDTPKKKTFIRQFNSVFEKLTEEVIEKEGFPDLETLLEKADDNKILGLYDSCKNYIMDLYDMEKDR